MWNDFEQSKISIEKEYASGDFVLNGLSERELWSTCENIDNSDEPTSLKKQNKYHFC